MAGITVYVAKYYKDKPLNNYHEIPFWILPIQAGAALTDVRVADILDNSGDNISAKNPNYCELTVLYWIWKHCLKPCGSPQMKYYGLFQYRRVLDVDDRIIRRFYEKDLDAVLPFPMLHEPDITEHHQRYIKETDWMAMLQALEELAPEYRKEFDSIFSQPYFYNYNILIAKREVLLDYCEWLFPILKRIEDLSVPKASERSDRYMGYIGENLMTLYFLYNQKRLHIAHTGRLMLT